MTKPSRLNRNSWSRERTCVDCGVVESVRKDNPSTRCFSCAARKRQVLSTEVRRQKTLFRTCECCGKRFASYRARTRRIGKFCSLECRRAGMSVQRQCKECGAEFRVARSALGDNTNTSGNFCCRDHYALWLSRPDREDTPGSPWQKIRDEIIARWPFCAECGTSNGLEVHFIVPYRLTQDSSSPNLVPLCSEHHVLAERAFRAEEREDNFSLEVAQRRLQAYFRERQASAPFRERIK